jgi:SAM-dependent methyltransferase
MENNLTAFDKASKGWASGLFIDEDIIPFIFLKGIKNKIFLEAGCGEGYLCRYLVKSGNNIVYGIDNSNVLLEIAKNKEIEEPLGKYLFGDVRKLPYPNDFFDVSYSGGVIEHFSGSEDAISEMVRATKSGGTIIVGVPNKISFYYLAAQVLQLFNLYGPGYEKGFSFKWLEDQLKLNNCSNFEIIKVLKAQNIKKLGLLKKIILSTISFLDYIPYKLGFGGFFFYIICNKK